MVRHRTRQPKAWQRFSWSLNHRLTGPMGGGVDETSVRMIAGALLAVGIPAFLWQAWRALRGLREQRRRRGR